LKKFTKTDYAVTAFANTFFPSKCINQLTSLETTSPFAFNNVAIQDPTRFPQSIAAGKPVPLEKP
jgi:hypothetical protein